MFISLLRKTKAKYSFLWFVFNQYLMYRKTRDELCWIRGPYGLGYLHAAGQSLPRLICSHPPFPTLETTTGIWLHIVYTSIELVICFNITRSYNITSICLAECTD